ncbi:hypothetical protein YC2023_047467 [Brassica napus]
MRVCRLAGLLSGEMIPVWEWFQHRWLLQHLMAGFCFRCFTCLFGEPVGYRLRRHPRSFVIRSPVPVCSGGGGLLSGDNFPIGEVGDVSDPSHVSSFCSASNTWWSFVEPGSPSSLGLFPLGSYVWVPLFRPSSGVLVLLGFVVGPLCV